MLRCFRIAFLFRERTGGGCVQSDLFFSREALEAFEQEVARQRMHAHPRGALARHQVRRPAPEVFEQRTGRRSAGERFKQATSNRGRIEARTSPVGDVRAQARHQRFDEVGLQRPAAAARRPRRVARPFAFDGGQRELQAQRPTFGGVVQARAFVRIQAVFEAMRHDVHRFVERQAQVLHAQRGAVPFCDHLRDRQRKSHARADRDAQVRRRVVQQVAQCGGDGRRGEMFGVVDDEHRGLAARADGGEQFGDRFELCGAARVHRVRCVIEGVLQGHREAFGRVALVGRHPRDTRPFGLPLQAPLQEQGGLAVARGRSMTSAVQSRCASRNRNKAGRMRASRGMRGGRHFRRISDADMAVGSRNGGLARFCAVPATTSTKPPAPLPASAQHDLPAERAVARTTVKPMQATGDRPGALLEAQAAFDERTRAVGVDDAGEGIVDGVVELRAGDVHRVERCVRRPDHPVAFNGGIGEHAGAPSRDIAALGGEGRLRTVQRREIGDPRPRVLQLRYQARPLPIVHA